MEKTIRLYNNYGTFIDRSPIYLTKNGRLTLVISHNETYPLFAKVKNGGFEVYEIKDNKFEVELKKGTFTLEIVAMKDDEVIKTFSCETIVIKEIGGEFKCFNEFEAVKGELEDCKKTISTLIKTTKTLTQLVSADYGIEIKVGVEDE